MDGKPELIEPWMDATPLQALDYGHLRVEEPNPDFRQSV